MENVAGSVRLLESIRRHDSGIRLVFASSGGTVYGRIGTAPAREDQPLAPTGAYGLSKATVERYIDFYVQNHGLDAITLRIGKSVRCGPDVRAPVRGGDNLLCRRPRRQATRDLW